MSLQLFIARRLLLVVPMLLGITLISFLLTHLIPADPVTANLGDQAANDPQVVAAFRAKWGLDKPLYQQYGLYVWNLVHGNMGTSIHTRQPVITDLRQRIPATMELALTAMFITLLAAVPLGILAAVNRDGPVDQVARVIALIGVSTPVFWLGLLGIDFFYARLGWAPAPGRLSSLISPPPFITGSIVLDGLLAGRSDVLASGLRHLALPALTLAAYQLGVITRMMRSSMLEEFGEDYVRTARSKGLPRPRVILKHAGRNALIPVVTLIGLSFGALLSGTVVIETVFSWPGIGLYAFKSAGSLDFPAIMGAGIVVAAVYIFVNLAVDISYALLDPRIRVG